MQSLVNLIMKPNSCLVTGLLRLLLPSICERKENKEEELAGRCRDGIEILELKYFWLSLDLESVHILFSIYFLDV